MSGRKIPPELKDLSKFVEANGFTLAIPFDNIRCVGYIGRLDENGREHIVDDGSCFEGLRSIKPRRPGKIVLGDFNKEARFSLQSFLKVFVSIFGIDVGLQNAKSITLKFPKRFLQSNFFTEMEIEGALPKLSPACRKNVFAPNHFVVNQTLETDAIEYVVELKKKVDVKAQADLKKVVFAKAKDLGIGVEVSWESEKQFSIIVSDPETRLTVAYKTMRMAPVPFTP